MEDKQENADIDYIKQKAAEQLGLAEMRKKELTEKIKESMESLRKKSSAFKKEVVSKFKEEVVGIIALPPRSEISLEKKKDKKEEKPELLVLLEVKDSSKDLIEKLKKKQVIDDKIRKIAKARLPDVIVNTALLDEVWDMCMKAKYEILNLIAMGMPIYDKGWVGALRVAEIHKMKVLQKFEKYVVSYVIGGSMIRGEATKESDIDTYIVIDDTDVTRMTSAELKARLTNMIWSYAAEAGEIAGVQNKLNVQVYVLTDMWDSIKNANPVIFTFLRDGVPLYDRGMFAPWKLLLKKGKIKPTPEAIDLYMKEGKKGIERIQFKLKEMGVEDFFWSTITPTQGALMLFGVPPGAPKELSKQLREHFVKSGLLEEKYVKIWEEILQLRKDIEHGKVKEVSPKKIDDILQKTQQYLNRLEKLFSKVEKDKCDQDIKFLYEKAKEDAVSALHMIGIAANESTWLKLFNERLVATKLAPKRFYDLLKNVDTHAKAKTCSISKEEISRMNFEQDRFSNDVFNHIRAEKGKKVEKYKISAHYDNGKRTAGIWLLTNEAFIILDTAKADTAIRRFAIDKDGKLVDEKHSTLAEIESQLAKFAGTPTVLTKHTIESLKSILADDVKLAIGA
jgi:predicted nucleotidyltransferase